MKKSAETKKLKWGSFEFWLRKSKRRP